MSVTFSVPGRETKECRCRGQKDDCDYCYGCSQVDDLSMNVANSSARIILNMLSVNSPNLYGELDPNRVLCNLAMVEAGDHTRPGFTLGNVITAGYNEERIKRYIDTLCQFADVASQMGVNITYA